MKLHLPKLLLVAVLSCTMAQAEDVVQEGVYEITSAGTTTTIDGNLTANFLRIDINKNSTLVVNGDTVINSDRDCPRGSDNQYNPNYLASGSTIKTNSLTVNYDTNHAFSKGFTIQGTLKTDSFIVNSTEKSTCSVTITNGGSLESLSSDKGTLTIGENVKLNVGNPSASASGSISNMNTVIDGGSLKVQYYAAMDGITLNSGSIEIINYPDPNLSHIQPVDTAQDLGDITVNGGTISLNNANITSAISMTGGELNVLGDVETGDITVNGGTISLNNANITSDITMSSGADGTSGTLNILGDVETSTLTLNSGTINVGAIDEEGKLVNGTLNGIVLLDGATLNLISGELADVTMNSGNIVVENNSTIKNLTLNGGSIKGTLSDESSVTMASGTDLSVDVEGGEITATEGSTLRGNVKDSSIIAEGGEIAATISGTSSVVATSGITTISGESNDYSGDTVINGATLILKEGATVGTGTIELTSTDTSCGVFDMGDNALTNKLIVTGCTIRNAKNYKGDMEVSHKLVVEGVATAKKVTLIGEGTLVRDEVQGGSMTTDEVDVQTDGNAGLDVDLTINDNGTVTLNNGKVLSVMGSLTLGEGVSLRLSDDDYGVGDTLLSSTGTLTMGDVTLVYNDSTVELELQGNSLVLVSKFKQDKADAVAQGNWGIASASRAFVNTVRGQHSNTGCIANGRGTVWAAAFGAYNDMDGADINVKGAAVGVDTKVGSCSTVGLAVGYADGEVSPTGLRDVDQEGTYVALYGEHGLKKLSFTSCLSLDWVAAYGNTESEWNGMDWEQDSLQLNTRLNWNKKVTDRLCMSVFGGLEYFASESDTVNGVKTGSIQNLRGEIGVGARYVAWGTPGSEAVTDEKGATIAAARPGCEKLVLHGEIRYMNDLVRSNPVIRMNGLSGRGENPGRQGMGIEAGATYRIGERWSASANYGFNAMEDSKEHRVNVGASYTF